MTEAKKIKKRKIITLFVLFALIILLLIFSRQTTHGIYIALQLCATTIIPSLFPFMVASDLLMACQITDIPLPHFLERVTQKWLHVPASAIYLFLLGAVCGFPIGIKSAADLYNSNKLTLSETEKVICFCNNTGPAFVIAGVGGSLLGSVRLGVLLYAVQIISAIICGFCFAHSSPKRNPPSSFTQSPQRQQSVNFVDAVRNSTINILVVCGFVLLFSSLMEIIAFFCKNPILLGFISSFLEIGSASSMAASLFSQYPLTAILTASIAINFGGLSVHMQSAYFLSGIAVSFLKYLFAKLLQAVFSVIILFSLSPFLFFVFS